MRGIAAYAVILVHSGDATWGLKIDPAAENFRLLFYFAVPFFLATSFYLMVNKPKITVSQKFWRSRIERILIPYGVWTIVYILLKLAVFPLTNQTDQIASTLKDIWGIALFGGASYHLYFLPLLFTGSFLIFLARKLQRKQIGIKTLSCLFLFSLAVYQILFWTGNSFYPGVNTAFSSLLQFFPTDSFSYAIARILFVWLAWSIRCLPYLLASLIYVRVNFSPLERQSRYIVFFWLLIFLLVNIGNFVLPSALWEILVSFSMLNLAIVLSFYLEENKLIISLGRCSFGIYLVHPLIKSMIEISINTSLPAVVQSVSIASIAVYSIPTFILSWYVVSVGMHNKLVAKYMFGA